METVHEENSRAEFLQDRCILQCKWTLAINEKYLRDLNI